MSCVTTSKHTSTRPRFGARRSFQPIWPPAFWRGIAAGTTISTIILSSTPAAPAAKKLAVGRFQHPGSLTENPAKGKSPAPCRQTPHIERHFTASEKVRDLVIGMSDGLTVPFALAAGLSGSPLASSAIVVTAGLAEVAAGSIAMGLGGYLAARSDAEHFANEKLREEREVQNVPDVEEVEVAEVFQKYGLSDDEIEPILRAFRKNHPAWVDFMMRFELGLEEPDPSRAVSSALTIAGAYIAGGLIPLVPYMLIPSTHAALKASVVVTLLALLVFGYVKGRFTGTRPIRSALQTMSDRRPGRDRRVPDRPGVFVRSSGQWAGPSTPHAAAFFSATRRVIWPIESRCSTPASCALTVMPKRSSRKTTSLSVVIESRIPPVINGVPSVSSAGSSPGRNSLKM